ALAAASSASPRPCRRATAPACRSGRSGGRQPDPRRPLFQPFTARGRPACSGPLLSAGPGGPATDPRGLSTCRCRLCRPGRAGRQGDRAIRAADALRLATLAQRRLGRRQTGDGHAVRRSGYVIEPEFLAEGDARRVAAMLAANAEFEVGPRCPAPLGAHADQLADAFDIEADKGIARIDALLHIRSEEPPGIVAADAQRGLGEVVGTEREEPCFLGNL